MYTSEAPIADGALRAIEDFATYARDHGFAEAEGVLTLILAEILPARAGRAARATADGRRSPWG